MMKRMDAGATGESNESLRAREKILPNILNAIGNTPLVKLNKIPKTEGIVCDMYAKCEYLNPGGSIKDRIAWRMVLDAERKGILIPGKSVIIEATSGNTGIGLALLATLKGYRCIIVLPDRMSEEKVNTMIALGAEIIRTRSDVPFDDPESDIKVARRLVEETPNAVMLDQFANPSNPAEHYDSTAEEILLALDNDVDLVVMGAGTGGTVTGVTRKFNERCPKCKVLVVDPFGSYLAVPASMNITDIKSYEIEGIGSDFVPRTLDRTIINRWLKSEDGPSFQMTRRLIKEEGLLCGGSSGAAMWAAVQAAKDLKAGQKCVVLLPDSIRNYMSRFVSNPWMEARRFQPIPRGNAQWWNELITEKMVQPIQIISNKSTFNQAITMMKKSHACFLAVVDDDGFMTGIFTADKVRRRHANLGFLRSNKLPLDLYLIKKLYSADLDKKDTLGRVSRLLDMVHSVIIVKSNKPIGIMTSGDLLEQIIV